jgi:integrase
MPAMKRLKTDYVGVYYVRGHAVGTGKPEKIFYIAYRRNGKLIEEKAGRQFQDAMTPARAARIRAERIEGKSLPNKQRREKKKRELETEKQRWTISKIWNTYEEASPSLRGMRTDRNRFEKHLKPIFGDKEFKDLSPLDLDRLRVSLSKTKALQTVKHILSLLKRLSNFAIAKRLCPGIEFKVKLPKVSNEKTEDLNSDQVRSLLKAIEEDPHPQAGGMLKLALYTGMRRSEIFRLEWKDLDFDRGFIFIRNPKGGENQKIPMNAEARAILESIDRTESSFVFPGRRGGQWVDIKKVVNGIKSRARLPKDFRPFHGLRHTFASILVSSGQVDLYTLQKLLTHKSPEMVQRYSHLRDETLKRAAALAGELVNQIVQEKDNGKTISQTG